VAIRNLQNEQANLKMRQFESMKMSEAMLEYSYSYILKKNQTIFKLYQTQNGFNKTQLKIPNGMRYK